MEVFVVGTSHSLAPTAVREQLHVDVDEIYTAVRELIDQGVMSEAVPLATCARLELYGYAKDPERASKLLLRKLSGRVDVPRSALQEPFFTLRGATAVRHLFRVASGLDSVVHGEAQILGQVRGAAHHPLAKGTKSKILHRLFDTALATGKRVRAETDIGRGTASLASAAIALVKHEICHLDSVRVLVLGAGETGSLVARLLRKAGVRQLVVANRTLETALDVAESVGGEGVSLTDLDGMLSGADLVVGAVTASEFLVTPESLARARAMTPRQDSASGAPPSGEATGPRYFLDLGHPRNFDPALASDPGVRLFDLDNVFERVEAARDIRATHLPRAEEIVTEQADAFQGWLRSLENVEVLRAVRKQVLALARTEADRFAQGSSTEDREKMRRLARSLARTLLHAPTVALRDTDPESAEGRSLLEAAPTLFGIQAPRSDASEQR